MPRQQLLEMADGNGDGDGQQRLQLQWPTVTETAMTDSKGNSNEDAIETVVAIVDGDHNGNGQWRWRWAAATAMATELATMTEMAMVIAMATAMARAAMTKGGLPLHVTAMCSTMAGATTCLHPHGYKGKCIHQRCFMGVTLIRVFPPFQGGGFLTANHGFFFCLLFTTTVQFTEQPSVCPPHYSGTQEPY
jgi:hypothetical protein